MRQKLRKISSLKIQTSVCESISFRIESSSLSSPASSEASNVKHKLRTCCWHNALRDALFSAAQSAALAPRLEAPSLVPSSSSRPADIFIPNWQAGRPAALDVSVISTLQPLTLSGSALSQGHALQVGEDRKVAAHQEDCLAVGVDFIIDRKPKGYDFIPLIAETLGRISRLMANRVGSSPSDISRGCRSACGVAMQQCGPTDNPPLPQAWMVSSDSLPPLSPSNCTSL